jgi:hypothetical protein
VGVGGVKIILISPVDGHDRRDRSIRAPEFRRPPNFCSPILLSSTLQLFYCAAQAHKATIHQPNLDGVFLVLVRDRDEIVP